MLLPAEQMGRAGEGVRACAGRHEAAVSRRHQHSVGRLRLPQQPQQLRVLVLTDVAQQPQHRAHLVDVQRCTPKGPPQSLCINMTFF